MYICVNDCEEVHALWIPICSSCQYRVKVPHLGCVWLRHTGNDLHCILTGPPRVPWSQPLQEVLRTWTVDSGRGKGVSFFLCVYVSLGL